MGKNELFRYRLSEKAPVDSMSLEGTVLEKGEGWIYRSFMLDKLTKHIRDFKNPEGWVDFEIYNAITEEVVVSRPKETPKNKYTRDDLQILNGQELAVIAREFLIDPANKTEKGLVRLILEEQKKYPAPDETTSETTAGENN